MNYMTELETNEFIRAFEKAGDACLAITRQHEPRIGRDVAVDATRYASPCQSYHCCAPGQCPRPRGKRVGKATPEPLSSGKDVDDARHEEQEEAPPLTPDEERAMIQSSWVGKDGSALDSSNRRVDRADPRLVRARRHARASMSTGTTTAADRDYLKAYKEPGSTR
jgi:hypothetical protein